ncbi:hypothetical protein NDI54_20970 [Haloarcula sp. S1AR25-5A]|uniref:Uncharacterized protein n=1 Tax=Haloarcula terrestris TaxID=2950533 RepID=A0AAE4JKZ2_9EURY|nr:hypothetical protein [Haloarcula terrestris]MDS0223804.1 hypothetical protein [Haloarcula terrestris]
MSEVWYPPNFGQWPAEAQGVWYSVNSSRGEAIRQLRETVGVDTDKPKQLTIEDIAAAVECLSDGDRTLSVSDSRRTCLSAMYDEAGIEREPKSTVSIEDMGALMGALRDEFPTSPYPVGESW